MTKKRATMLTPITMDKESVYALGLVTSYFSHLESVVHLITWNVLELSDFGIGTAVTGRMEILRVLELLQRAADEKITDPDQLHEIKKFCEQVNQIREKRNRLVHANWQAYSMSKRAAISVHVTLNKKMTQKPEWYTSDDIYQVAEEILRGYESARKLVKLLYNADLPGNFAFVK